MDRQRFVQQYVERQKAYIPSYTTANERRTPPKQPRSDLEFGFDTPVLRPRAPLKPQLVASEQGSTSGHAKEKPRNKRKKGSAPVDTDNERTARLADRRERKRKKRVIMSPKEDEENVRAARPRKGKANMPAALALMYGFSATNVTKDRLTLKPAPSLGVFSKGKASAKKKVATTRKSTSRNELFSESAFLNKPSERSDDPSEIDDGSDDGSTPNHSVAQETRVPNRAKKDRGKTPALKKPSAAESEIWDIEMQSKLPSSVCDVSSEPETKESVPVVLDLRGAEWSASIDVATEHEKRQDQTSRIESVMICSSPRAGSDLLATYAADVSSLHPSHSASQVGRRTADTQASDPRLVTSKYFVEPEPVFEQVFIPEPTPNDDMDVLGVEDQYVEDTELDVYRVVSPMGSPTSVPPHMTEFRSQYDVVPRSPCEEYVGDAELDVYLPSMNSPTSVLPHMAEFRGQYDMVPRTNECPCEDCWRGANEPSELLGSDLEPAIVETQGDRSIDVDGSRDWCPGEHEGGYGPHEYDIEATEPADESWEACMDESIGWNDGADFLEGRALLRGVEGAGWVGLDEVERDVASRLRYHWRPLRL